VRRFRFAIRATTAGWSWLVGAWNHIGVAFAIVALVGIGTYTRFRPHHWWLVIVYLAGVLILCFAEGAYQIWDKADRAAAGLAGDLGVALSAVVRRLKGMQTIPEGEVWDKEKWHLGGQLDRLGEAIAQAKAGPEWNEAWEQTQQRVLLAGDRGAIDDCLSRLEGLG
jgi:hypothetical protein